MAKYLIMLQWARPWLTGMYKKKKILTTTMDIGVIGKVIPTPQKFGFLVFKNAKGNRTLLGADVLRAAGIVLNLQKGQWYFSGTPHQQFNFIATPPDIKSLLVMPPASHPYQRHRNEGARL
ncbi:hypothetical protein CEXT_457541 [Caerostris extrusa]|uniref:Uncharacterized protein n=1 Tax=Caerostris extrusa TaxID=172846 RepID=A0AAV4S5W1_CAEEX|nr:hypothetical protein CEXT_457541 [Caerostris extrusa]